MLVPEQYSAASQPNKADETERHKSPLALNWSAGQKSEEPSHTSAKSHVSAFATGRHGSPLALPVQATINICSGPETIVFTSTMPDAVKLPPEGLAIFSTCQ